MQKLVLWKTNLTATPPLFPWKQKKLNLERSSYCTWRNRNMLYLCHGCLLIWVFWETWSEFSAYKPFFPWSLSPHALRIFLLCDSWVSFWQRLRASSQLVVWSESGDTHTKKGKSKLVPLTMHQHGRSQMAAWWLLTLLYLAFGCRLLSTASTHSCSLDESM